MTLADGRTATAVAERQPVAPALLARSREVPDCSNDPEALLDGLFIPTAARSNHV
ncbi:MAG: hypothetical protein OXB91_01545 [Bryobacterales bacterium]|nr:hypothetical protein [Bryobacterales bacterium]